MKPLPRWAAIALHLSILAVVGAAGATTIVTAIPSGNAKTIAVAIVAGAGWIATYVLKSPLVLGWLSLHDPADVADAADARLSESIPVPPITKKELP